MKVAVKGLGALIAGALVLGMLTTAPASAGEDVVRDICKRIDGDLKRLDKELFGWMKR
jgi:hypothetical protein